jgi:hypothetical protein
VRDGGNRQSSSQSRKRWEMSRRARRPGMQRLRVGYAPEHTTYAKHLFWMYSGCIGEILATSNCIANWMLNRSRAKASAVLQHRGAHHRWHPTDHSASASAARGGYHGYAGWSRRTGQIVHVSITSTVTASTSPKRNDDEPEDPIVPQDDV